MSGMERHPSSAVSRSSDAVTIRGFTSTRGGGSSSPTSTTAALQRAEQLAVALLLLALGADEHDVEDRDERGDLDQEDGEPTRSVLAGRGEAQREHWEHGHADPDRR